MLLAVKSKGREKKGEGKKNNKYFFLDKKIDPTKSKQQRWLLVFAHELAKLLLQLSVLLL